MSADCKRCSANIAINGFISLVVGLHIVGGEEAGSTAALAEPPALSALIHLRISTNDSYGMYYDSNHSIV